MVLANTYALLTKAEIETAVVAYWKALSAKNAVQQQNFYDDQAGMFSTESKKLERARMVLSTADSEEHLKNARVTHIFQRQSDGAVRIVHEHISVPRL